MGLKDDLLGLRGLLLQKEGMCLLRLRMKGLRCRVESQSVGLSWWLILQVGVPWLESHRLDGTLGLELCGVVD